jgi:hypothetical protein
MTWWQIRRRPVIAGWVVATAVVCGCAGERRTTVPSNALNPADARALIDKSMPRPVADRQGWVADIYAAFSVLDLPATPSNICAVIAVIEQESSFRVDPVVPNLPAIAWRTIDERAAAVGVPRLLVHGLLKLNSPNGHSYAERIDDAKTEKQLSDIFEDFIGTVPMGRTLFAEHNPIRTRGPMQVQVTFAEQQAAAKPYPYPVKTTIGDEVFTRRGGVYFGIAHLLAYQADYDRYLYRFADFNAGRYASRDAAFQSAVSAASGIPLIPDGWRHGTGGADLGRALESRERRHSFCSGKRPQPGIRPVIGLRTRVQSGGSNGGAWSAARPGPANRAARPEDFTEIDHRMVCGARQRTLRTLSGTLTVGAVWRQIDPHGSSRPANRRVAFRRYPTGDRR